ncbi:uncharacterized protein LOC144099065 isoform X1 [Amblyomma americanum]
MAEYHVASRQHCGSGNVVGGNVSPASFSQARNVAPSQHAEHATAHDCTFTNNRCARPKLHACARPSSASPNGCEPLVDKVAAGEATSTRRYAPWNVQLEVIRPVEFPCGSPRLQVDRTWSPSQVNNQGAESGTIAAARINITITRGNFIYNVNPARHLYAPQRDCAERDC